ncbi:MAG: DNA-3-methyladenine glycosylase [Thermomicrobiales bacterium]
MRLYRSDTSFDLALTAAPVAWGRGRWPNVDWIGGSLIWAGWGEGHDVSVRIVSQAADGSLAIDGASSEADDPTWLDAVLGFTESMPAFTEPAIAALAREMPGLRPFANGDLFDGVIGSIVGQSISVAAAATTESRLARLVHPGIDVGGRTFFPFPRPHDLAALSVETIRSTGVTWRRAEAIAAIARLAVDGDFPLDATRQSEADSLRMFLRSLPLVGPWTAESALLWGLGHPDIHPTGDVALLRAARAYYQHPEMTMKDLDTLAAAWAPGRSWAARLLWTRLLGSAPLPRAILPN